ncbi:MAG: HXXEE domain-containing protein [Syntrophomonas sp.]
MIRNIFTIPGKIDLRKLIFVFPFIACLHELEEWNILAWHSRYNTNVPSDVTDANLHTIFILISVMFFIWTFISLLPKNKRTTAYIFFPLMAIGFVNGIEHLIWSIEFRVYAPGFIFGFLFEIPLILYIAFRIFKENLVAPWYSIAFGVLVVFGVVNLFLLGNELDPVIRSAMNFSKMFSDLILK